MSGLGSDALFRCCAFRSVINLDLGGDMYSKLYNWGFMGSNVLFDFVCSGLSIQCSFLSLGILAFDVRIM